MVNIRRKLLTNYFILCGSLLASGSLLPAMEAPPAVITGDYFTAIPVPGNVKTILGGVETELAACLGRDFSPSDLDNLHITIQVSEGDDVEMMRFALRNVPAPFKQFARQKGWDQPWHFEGKIQNASIQIGKEGHVKLHVGKSDLLIQLGSIIEQQLRNYQVHTTRNDVSGNYTAHITLGIVPKAKVDAAKSRLNHCRFDFNSKFARIPFIIDRFVLLRSNRPAVVRRYLVQEEYMLNLGK